MHTLCETSVYPGTSDNRTWSPLRQARKYNSLKTSRSGQNFSGANRKCMQKADAKHFEARMSRHVSLERCNFSWNMQTGEGRRSCWPSPLYLRQKFKTVWWDPALRAKAFRVLFKIMWSGSSPARVPEVNINSLISFVIHAW